MKIIFTKHSLDKFKVLKSLGWKISKQKVINSVRNPVWIGSSKFGQETAMSLLDEAHILRVVYNRENDIIKIITFHPARRGTYESTI